MEKLTLESFLKKKECFDQFKANYEAAMVDGRSSNAHNDTPNQLSFEDYLESSKDNPEAVVDGFYFTASPEGHVFWMNLSNEFEDIWRQ